MNSLTVKYMFHFKDLQTLEYYMMVETKHEKKKLYQMELSNKKKNNIARMGTFLCNEKIQSKCFLILDKKCTMVSV